MLSSDLQSLAIYVLAGVIAAVGAALSRTINKANKADTQQAIQQAVAPLQATVTQLSIDLAELRGEITGRPHE